MNIFNFAKGITVIAELNRHEWYITKRCMLLKFVLLDICFVKGMCEILMATIHIFGTLHFSEDFFFFFFYKLFYEISEISKIKAITNLYNYTEIVDFRNHLKSMIT